MSKKISIGAKPSPAILTAVPAADEWVQNRGAASVPAPVAEKEKMRRLTIDVSEELHRAIKSACAIEGLRMADVVRDLLSDRYLKR